MSLGKEKRNYRIIIAQNNKEVERIGAFVRRDSALREFKRLIDENENVIFPSKYVNTKEIKEVKYNLVLIKKRDSLSEMPTRLRNEYGEYVDHETTSKNWYVYDIHPYQLEEKFWIYGFDPRTDRKDTLWIYENLIKPYASNKDKFLNIKLYKNKIVLVSCNEYNMIICKNKSDAIRLYNLIEGYCNENKYKYAIFSGDYSISRKYALKIIEEIKSFTNWDSRKITRLTTRP